MDNQKVQFDYRVKAIQGEIGICKIAAAKQSVMRFLLPFVFSLLYLAMAHGQFVYLPDATTIHEFPGTKLPPMIGEAAFYSEQFKVIVGGKFLDAKSQGLEAIYNCDMLVLDYEADKTYVLPLSYFPPFVADQFSGIHYCYTMDKDTAYLLGGYGYDLAKGYEATFPFLTIFPLKTLIDRVVQHKEFLGLFELVSDNRLAVMEGTLMHLGQYFVVTDGKEITPVQEEFTDRLTVNEWNYRGQLRKFRLKSPDGFREVDEFQICTTAKTLHQCIPSTWRPKPTKVTLVDRSNN